MKTIKYISAILFLLSCLSFAQNSILQKQFTISGIVTDENEIPIPYVNVYILNSTEGTMTEEDGRFSFKSKQSGEVEIMASSVGFKQRNFKIKLDKNLDLKIQLRSSTVELNEAVVTASSYGSEKEKGIVISAMDVITTPGGAADIFQSLKTLPGLTQVSESAELYVRGGDPSETITMIDQASVYHPYTYESSYGGLFSNINTAMVKGMYFSSGGFSAKYGNILSGVLDLQTKDEVIKSNFTLGISLASAQLSGELPLLNEKLSLLFSGRQNFTSPIYWLNGGRSRFSVLPMSKDFSGILSYKFSKTGRLKFFTSSAFDKTGVNIERAEFNGTFNGSSKNNLYNLQLSEILFSDLLIKSSFSFTNYKNLWKLGILDLNKTDKNYKIRTDAEYRLFPNLNLLSGFEIEKRSSEFLGVIPKNDFDYRPAGESEILNAEINSTHSGIYSELEFSNPFGIKNFFTISGIRFDHVSKINKSWIDPRFSFGYRLSQKSTLKFGYGIFHQHADPRLYSASDGNPNLQPMKAVHYIGSLDYNFNSETSVRFEIYQKDYSNLPLEDEILNYNNNGHGFARGVDFMAKGSFFGIDGWISYGYINTKRLWMDFDQFTSSSFDITHNFTVVAKYNFNANWQLGMNYKFATGRPFTPVEDANRIENSNIFEPVYGITNSERYQNYKRLDLRVTYLTQLFNKYFSVFYVEALNILNIKNIFDYRYSADYKEKYEVESYFGRRTVVFGTQINF